MSKQSRLQNVRDGRKPDSDYDSTNLKESSSLRNMNPNVEEKPKKFLIDKEQHYVQEKFHQESTKEKKPKYSVQNRILLQQCKPVNEKFSESVEIDSTCVSHESENEIVTAKEFIGSKKMTHLIAPSNDSPNSPLMTTHEKDHADVLNNEPKSAEEIESLFKDKFKNSSTLQPIRDHVDNFFNAEDSTVVKVKITLPSSLFDAKNLYCDEYRFARFATINRDISVGWVIFFINKHQQQEDYFTSMTCHPIPVQRQQKSKMVLYHSIRFTSPLPENSEIIMNNVELLVEHKYLKKYHIFKAKSKHISIIVIIIGCGERCLTFDNVLKVFIDIFLSF